MNAKKQIKDEKRHCAGSEHRSPNQLSKRSYPVRVTRVTRMTYSPRLWLMAIGW